MARLRPEQRRLWRNRNDFEGAVRLRRYDTENIGKSLEVVTAQRVQFP